MQTPKRVIIIGAGPAGLMAAERIIAAGHDVHVYDAKPSACRKFLLAGVGGMNITHSEPYDDFLTRYYEKSPWMAQAISQFDADALQQWIHGFGVETFVGSSGRVFPTDMKAAPLLRSWLKRLRAAGVVFHMRHRLIEMDQHRFTFEHNETQIQVQADAAVLSMGGASWPKLGSDGKWQGLLLKHGVDVAPLQSANCGFYSQWSEHLQQKFAGSPLKNIAITVKTLTGESVYKKGECIVSEYGMEGSLIYAFSKYLRDIINANGQASCKIDLLPDISEKQLVQKLSAKQGKDSLSKFLKRTIALSGVKAAMLYECCDKSQFKTPQSLAECIKAIVVRFNQVRPIEEVISSAGGVCESSVDEHLMLNRVPGVFCAGEMLDWEAPTGGYLLTACFATGRLAGEGVNRFLQG